MQEVLLILRIQVVISSDTNLGYATGHLVHVRILQGSAVKVGLVAKQLYYNHLCTSEPLPGPCLVICSIFANAKDFASVSVVMVIHNRLVEYNQSSMRGSIRFQSQVDRTVFNPAGVVSINSSLVFVLDVTALGHPQTAGIGQGSPN